MSLRYVLDDPLDRSERGWQEKLPGEESWYVQLRDGDEIFLHALRLAGVGAEEAVFVDNSRDNLVAPGALGIKTIFHDDEKNDIAALSEALASLGLLARDA